MTRPTTRATVLTAAVALVAAGATAAPGCEGQKAADVVRADFAARGITVS